MENKSKLAVDLTRRDMLRYGFLGSVLAGLPPSLWLTGCNRISRKKRPNIFLISVDTLRPDHLGCYGYSRNTSGNIDLFAKDGLLFENCFSHAPNTWSSCASMLTGFLPHEAKILNPHVTLQSGVRTLPEILEQQGYTSIAVVSNYVLRKGQGFEQGFKIYDDSMNEQGMGRNIPERIAEHTTAQAIELLTRFSKDQLFMWIHYQDPHGPYTPPERYTSLFLDPDQKPRHLKLSSSLSGRGAIPSYQQLGSNRDYNYYVSQYNGEIRYVDENFQRFIDTLKNLGLYDNSLIIFTSDHGEDLGEHDYFFTHGENLYNSLIRVPLIVKYGDTLAGRRKDFVQHLDILPTIYNILDMKPDAPFRGGDLREQQQGHREIISEMNSLLVDNEFRFSIINNGLKLIYTPLYKQFQMFDLKVDINEEKNLINRPDYKGQVLDLNKRLERAIKEDPLKLKKTLKPKELTEEEIKNLKSLGYVQ